MKKMKTKNKCLVTSLAIIAMLMMSLGVKAQTVHIGLDNGSLLTGVGPGNDSGWEQGFSTMWRHEQLSLTMMASDRDKLEASGEMGYPSNVFSQRNGKITIIGGRRPSFLVVSLPKGYRITGYTIVLSNDLQGANFGGRFSSINDNDEGSGRYGTMRFYETAPWETNGTNSGTVNNPEYKPDERDAATYNENGEGYNENRVKNIEPGPNWQGNQIGSNGIEAGKYFIAQALDASGNGDINTNDTSGKEYTISRTAQKVGQDPETGVDLYNMGNQLYFRLVKDYCFYGITIKEFRLEFTAEGTFAADVVPETVGAATSCVASPFKTSKIDIGEMRERTKVSNNQSYTHYAFEYAQIDDVQAYNYLYQDDAIQDGAPADVAEEKNIRPVEVDGKMLYALKSDTYFLETPIEIATSGGNSPIGYRIVGALFTPLWGTATTNFTPGPYKLKIWKRDGSGLIRWTYDDSGYLKQTDDESGKEYIEISDGSDTDLSKVIDIGLCNNDAIKFEIETTGENAANTQALVQVTLLLQALDPYIDKMDIVCTEDEGEVLHLTQSFTADDFSVSGGKFIFYVPTDYIGKLLKFTFSDLYSKYGDETYYDGGSGSARYSFVTSEYFNKFDGYTNGNEGLYSNLYKTSGPNYPYNTKVYTSTAGNIRFKFNNAEDLASGAQSGNLVETPFTVAAYYASTDPGDPLSSTPHGPNTSIHGTFIPVKLKASTNQDENSGTFFVFTADETRWNIAPTTAWQHRFYAFYRMEIEVRARTFTPDFTWTQIYDKTSYAGKDDQGKEIDLDKSMWGVTLDVADEENGQKVQGYLTYQEIINAINAQIADSNIETPEGTDQILYIDGTPLYAMLNSAVDQDVIDVADLQPLLAKNALIFLPENTTSLEDNVAYETSTGFVAGKDIVLTDKYPFFTPYEIQVASANHATYKREKSGPNSGLVTHGTVVLPFTLRVNGGKHVNDPEDGFEFNVRRLSALATATTAQTSENNYYSEGYFPTIEGSETKANMPYMVEVTATPSGNSQYSFVVSQAGSTIYATPFEKNTNGKITKGHKNFKGETVTNNKDGGSLTNYGTYSGMTIPRDNNVYYFNKDKYVSSTTLATKYDNAIVRPFRAYYSPSEVALFSKMIGFTFVYDLFSGDGGITTSLTETSKPKVMTITTSNGTMLITATENVPVNIKSVNGLSVDSFKLKAGEQKQVNLPSGIYIVNNTKILVK
jgi:hypothetical protein